MTDLNKEREAFEADQNTTLLFERIEYIAAMNAYMPKFEYANNLIVMQAAERFNFGWSMWQKAKAQAVPEGYVVVPKQPTPKMIDATWDFDDEIIEMSSNTRNEFIWKKMVEASESGAEQ
ncbi:MULTISPECIES: hypothetical protein [Acinetobacter calcoaceticus/baumannii complex]|uniref:hypothetical protein n=1 Tax=Acinetobacter calcoaceticus/baumannii complex TaxID=909768 RepID=UPI001AE182F6|nr:MULTISPECIES: hypothetical protein [Acinetobacter calcoaceticus/baumannii complex]MBP1471236.1 hypothetical protein [Acinetobacter nosocomialis]MCL8261794.1 hypothetical protein [Acinetobacter baumannii]